MTCVLLARGAPAASRAPTPNHHLAPPPAPAQWGWANFAPHRPAGQAGNAEFPTPNLAALAAEGITFDRLYAVRFRVKARARATRARSAL